MSEYFVNRLFILSTALVFSLLMVAPSYGQFNLFDHSFGSAQSAGSQSFSDHGYSFIDYGGGPVIETLTSDSINLSKTGLGDAVNVIAQLPTGTVSHTSADYTYYIRFNANGVGTAAQMGFDVIPGVDGSSNFDFRVDASVIAICGLTHCGGGTSEVIFDPAAAGVDMTIPHDYHIHKTGTGANSLKVYLDNDFTTPILQTEGNSLGSPEFDGKVNIFWLSTQNDPNNLRQLHRFAAGDGNVFVGPPGPEPRTFTWILTGSGDWNQRSNWDPSGVPTIAPNGNQDAIFSDTTLAGSTVFTDTAVSVRRIDFDHDQTYVVAGFGSVNLVSGTDSAGDVPPVVNTLQGTHEFQVRVNLHNNSTVNVASNSTLMFSNTLNLDGLTLTKTGVGTMSIRNDFVTGGGTLNIADGTVSGNGTIGGSVDNNGGVISPGNNAVAAGSQVPEPASLLGLVLGGLLVCWAWGRRNWVLGECRA